MKAFEKERRKCASCSAEFETFRITTATECFPCQQVARARDLRAYKAQEHARIPFYLDQRLESLGLAKVERQAVVERIPDALMAALPQQVVRDLLACQAPSRGFGLAGTMGAGKTAALAAILATGLRRRMEAALEGLTDAPSSPQEARWHLVGRLRWVSWPGTAAWMKGAFSRRDGNAEVEDFVELCISTNLLVLDDLGRERMRGAYTEDFALGQLDRIVDARARDGRPILWTTNQEARELAAIYGGAMMDRLLDLAPLVQLPKLPSLRGA